MVVTSKDEMDREPLKKEPQQQSQPHNSELNQNEVSQSEPITLSKPDLNESDPENGSENGDEFFPHRSLSQDLSTNENNVNQLNNKENHDTPSSHSPLIKTSKSTCSSTESSNNNNDMRAPSRDNSASIPLSGAVHYVPNYDAKHDFVRSVGEDDQANVSDSEAQESRILNPGPVNLETIKEGEILEIPQELQTPREVVDRQSRSTFKDFFIGSQNDLVTGEDEDAVVAFFNSRRRSTSGSVNAPFDKEDDAGNLGGSLIDLPAELPPPPDGGWGWVIVLASFLANMTLDGIAYSFSPFLDAFSKYYSAPKGTVAWISSLLAGMYLSVGPVVSSLTNRFGCRAVCICGALIGAAAYASTIFANSIVYLMVTQGVIAGFGFGLIYLPAVVCVGYYFEARRALATGIAVCGSGVGTMIFPPLVNLLIANYGWQGTNLLLAGLILNCCWMGALMRPLEVPKMKRKDLLHRLAEEKKIAMERGSLYGSNYITITHQDGTVEKRVRSEKMLNYDPGVHSHLNLSEYLTPTNTSVVLPTIQEGGQVDPQPNGNDVQSALLESGTTNEEEESLVKKAIPSPVMIPSNRKDVSDTTKDTNDKSKIPRNNSQPAMGRNGSVVPKRGSVPNFERRVSRIEIMTNLKVIPATPHASHTNLRVLGGSGDVRRYAGGAAPSMGSFGDTEAMAGLRQRRHSKEKKAIMLPPMSRQDIFYSGSIRNLDEFKSQASMLSYRESTFNLQNASMSRAVSEAFAETEDEADEAKHKKCFPEDVCAPFKEMMDFSLLKNPVFLLIGLANTFGMLGFYTPFVYLPSAAIEKGIDKDSAMLLVSIIGITNTIGRVLSGLIADLPQVNSLWVNNISLILSGVCVFLTPFAYSFSSFVAISIFFGFFVSAYISLTSIILVELLGLERLTNAFGLLILFRGSASFVGPPLAGSIYDASKSYDVSFYSSGGLLFICAFLHCIVPFIQRFCACHENPVRYHTNEEYLQAIPEEDMNGEERGDISPDAGEGAGIMFDIKPKNVRQRDRQERDSISSAGSK